MPADNLGQINSPDGFDPIMAAVPICLLDSMNGTHAPLQDLAITVVSRCAISEGLLKRKLQVEGLWLLNFAVVVIESYVSWNKLKKASTTRPWHVPR